MLTDLFILGASGFVGSATVRAAREAGLTVGAWARTEAQAEELKRQGVEVTAPPHIPNARVVIDLIQPKLPEARAPRSVPRWLASLVVGSVAASSFARDVPTDPSALFATGFALRYASIATGLPATIARLEAA